MRFPELDIADYIAIVGGAIVAVLFAMTIVFLVTAPPKEDGCRPAPTVAYR